MPIPGVIASSRVATATTGLLNNAAILAPRNGTTSHTVTPSTGTLSAGTLFTPTAGRFLLCVVSGAVTSTTPAGWTLPTNGSLVSGTGLYVFYKASAAGGDTLTTTHNGSNYEVIFHFFEFPATTAFQDAQNGSLTKTQAHSTVSGLTGTTNVAMGAKALGNPAASGAISATWNLSMTEALDLATGSGPTDGVWLGIGYRENYSSATFQPTCTVTTAAAGNMESVTWVVKTP